MRTASIALAILLFAVTGGAQQPRILHGTVTTVPAAPNLGAQIRASKTAFIGYSVPEIEGEHVMCCFNTYGDYHTGGTCSLDRDGSSFNSSDRDDLHVASSDVFAIVYRVENGEIARVRSYSMDCGLEANGAAVTWIDGVDPKKSVALLASMVGNSERRSDSVMPAIAMHADPSATTELERILNSSTTADETRGKAAFWLGQTRGRRGYEDVLAVAQSSSASPRLREKAVFALSQSKEPGAIDALINLAKHDPTAHVRSQAIFWLSQKAGNKAAGAIRASLDDDPDSSVREKAVFAISQLPDGESVPMLIELMKSHRDPSVRKKAAFWLGQKHDSRALAAIEDILRK
ncbi:MAG TPA: HEAT repeat domain-containing protein [Thermoanaerobaculia bacterium]|jgi:HEAT repeat protein|nr:HEAT repeat domain-containing protein [Thermoanaerobaculia bacterium]